VSVSRRAGRQHHRQIPIRHRHHSVVLAIHHRNRRAPISLARNPPILQPKGRLPPPKSLFLRKRRHLDDRHIRRQSVIPPRIHQLPVRMIPIRFGHFLRNQRFALRRLHHNSNRQTILPAKFEIPLVMRRNAHHRPGAVFQQHEIPYPDRDRLTAERIHNMPPGKESFLLRGRQVFRSGRRRAHLRQHPLGAGSLRRSFQ
jgi:hypothetical protein